MTRLAQRLPAALLHCRDLHPARGGERSGLTRVVVLHANRSVRERLRTVIESVGESLVVGDCATLPDAMNATEARKADVVVVDGGTGPETARMVGCLHGQFPSLAMVAMTDGDGPAGVNTIRAGAAAWLGRDVSPEELVGTIRSVARGAVVIGPELRDALREALGGSIVELSDTPLFLTRREEDVLALVGAGLSNTEVAASLFVAHKTVRNAVSALYHKLGVRSRGELVVRARRAGLGVMGVGA